MADLGRRSLLQIAVAAALSGGSGAAMAASAHDFTFDDIEGKPMSMADFKGKAVLVVNTASFCGYTPQYEGLQTLWEQNKDKGLVVLGVPANDFGAQEPGSNEEIKTFCESKYDVTFPMTSKQVVVGSRAHPFYKWAADTLGQRKAPQWNFHKYLVGADGALIDAFESDVEPTSRELRSAVAAALPK